MLNSVRSSLRKDLERSGPLEQSKSGSSWVTQAQKHNYVLMGSFNNSPNRKARTASPGLSVIPSTGSYVVAGTARAGELGRFANSEKARGVKHLSYSELMERKNIGLCFRCGERYHPMHK